VKVPREIDELMWVVAETGDPETNAQFLERYPEFASELDQRVKMVSNLRGSRPQKSPAQFIPRETVRSFGPSRLAVAGVAALVLGSVTFATFATVQFVNSKRSQHPLVDAPQEIIFNPPSFTVPDGSSGTPIEGVTANEPLASGTAPIQEQPPFDPYKGLITIESEDIQLSAAIQQIASSAGLEATIAPGFEDKRIKISFVNQPAIEVLNKLGTFFGFTPVKEGVVDVLIIPAKQSGVNAIVEAPGTVGTATGPGTTGTGPKEAKKSESSGGS
jgi:hypothetical protein